MIPVLRVIYYDLRINQNHIEYYLLQYNAEEASLLAGRMSKIKWCYVSSREVFVIYICTVFLFIDILELWTIKLMKNYEIEYKNICIIYDICMWSDIHTLFHASSEVNLTLSGKDLFPYPSLS